MKRESMLGKRIKVVKDLRDYETLGYVDDPKGYIVTSEESSGVFVKGYHYIILNGDYTELKNENSGIKVQKVLLVNEEGAVVQIGKFEYELSPGGECTPDLKFRMDFDDYCIMLDKFESVDFGSFEFEYIVFWHEGGRNYRVKGNNYSQEGLNNIVLYLKDSRI